MRITQSMINENFSRNLMQNLKRLADKNDMMSSLKKIRRPSDDPVGAAIALKLRRNLSAIEQYNSNAKDALTWMTDTETALSNTGDILKRLKELTLDAANGTKTAEDRKQILYEIQELKDQILQQANSTSVDRYLFSGYNTDKAPFIKKDDGSVELNTEINPDISTGTGVIEFNIGNLERVSINLLGPDVFNEIFNTLDKLETAINDDDTESLSGHLLQDIDTSLETVLMYRSQVGARSNRLEAVVSRLDASEINYKERLSYAEDVDLAQMITDLKMEESVYRASLAIGARIIQPSLVDYLR
ncbi:MAG: flagellar hook-associated protein FlgL [Tepidanaerobacteraceae bacterium]|nr:flagellar hook-associated protein FlgL [Thermoanaerobacterales bacterium]